MEKTRQGNLRDICDNPASSDEGPNQDRIIALK